MSTDDLRWVLSRPNERQVYEVIASGATTAEAVRALEAEPELQVVGDSTDGRAHVPGRTSLHALRTIDRESRFEAESRRYAVDTIDWALVDAGHTVPRDVAEQVAEALYEAGFLDNP